MRGGGAGKEGCVGEAGSTRGINYDGVDRGGGKMGGGVWRKGV